MFTDPNPKTEWQRRAERVGFHVWQNKRVLDMTDAEIKAAFDGLAETAGIHYIPRVPHGAE